MEKKQLIFEELKQEHDRCCRYFDLMYKTLDFTFVAFVALIAIICTLFAQKDVINVEVIEILKCILLAYVVPIIVYVFGIMYIFNAYALSVCGKREEKLHEYCFKKFGKEIPGIEKNIISDRWITLISYGVPLGFFITIPCASIVMSIWLTSPDMNIFISLYLPFICLIVYYLLMLKVIMELAKSFWINQK